MTIELPEQLESALKVHANARGISPDVYVLQMLERDLEPVLQEKTRSGSVKTTFGLLARYGTAPTADEIDENRRGMFAGTVFDSDIA